MSAATLRLCLELVNQLTLGSIAPGMEDAVLAAKRELVEALALADAPPNEPLLP